MTRAEFLQDTIDYYSVDPKNRRALSAGGNCMYRTPDGRKCAIGRYIEPDKYKTEFEGMSIYGDNFDTDCLPQDILDLGLGFLRDVQRLHYDRLNWGDTGLSERGQSKVKQIRENYC